MSKTKLMLGDNIQSLQKLPENSVDSIVTDPPYGLSFMGKKWDYDVPSVEFWREVYRVLKPGGHILSFGGTRTYHRMVVNIEDAGFEIRDQVMWLYGSGFPKSHNIGKAVDKIEGNDREVVRTKPKQNDIRGGSYAGENQFERDYISVDITKGQSKYEGWGTALKPANEPICVARKPLTEKTIADNVMKWGTGGINIEGCRVGSEIIPEHTSGKNALMGGLKGGDDSASGYVCEAHEGRFPANIILDETAAELLDEQSKGSSKFFYQAKVGKRERNLGLDSFEEKKFEGRDDLANGNQDEPFKKRPGSMKNNHPTLKPINLMTYLCRLVTPEGGIVLDPFMGSGSTGIAARLEGFRFLGMELDKDYFKIAEARIEAYEQYRDLLK